MSESENRLPAEFLKRHEVVELDSSEYLVPQEALTCEYCQSEEPPALVKPERGSVNWWDDPSWFWICPECAKCRKLIWPEDRPEPRD